MSIREQLSEASRPCGGSSTSVDHTKHAHVHELLSEISRLQVKQSFAAVLLALWFRTCELCLCWSRGRRASFVRMWTD